MLSLLLAAASAMLAASTAQGQTFEQIRSYDVTIEIRTDDSLRITETIVYDFGSSEHHGIYRDVPTRLAYDGR